MLNRWLSAILTTAFIVPVARGTTYQHDSGAQMQDLFITGGGHALLMNRYAALPGRTQITRIEFPWHNARGAQAQVVIWSDPDHDGLPLDASLLWSAVISGSGGHASAGGSIGFVQVSVPSVSVGPAGSNFFIGFIELSPLVIQQPFTAVSFDPGAFVPSRGFALIDHNHPIPPDKLVGIAPIEELISSFGPFPDTPTIAIRATAIPAPSGALPALAAPFFMPRCRRR